MSICVCIKKFGYIYIRNLRKYIQNKRNGQLRYFNRVHEIVERNTFENDHRRTVIKCWNSSVRIPRLGAIGC